MELLNWLLLLIPCFFLPLFFLEQHLKQASRRLPPGPFNLPVIGSVHQMLGTKPVHHTLRDLSAVYGPIMHLRLGEIPTIIISSSDAAREIMKTHDLTFASRSVTTSVEIITKGVQDISFSPYGEFWRQMRRICVLALLSPKRTRSFASMRAEEVLDLLRSIESLNSSSPNAAVNLSEKLGVLANNVTVRASIGGKSSDGEQKQLLWVLNEVKEAVSGFGVADLFPSVPFLAAATGLRRKLERCREKVDRVLDRVLHEHRERRKAAGNMHEDVDDDLIDVLLRIQQDDSLKVPLSDDHIKGVICDIFAGGSETSATTVDWAMSELIRSPAAMRKAQLEVRAVLSGGHDGDKEAKRVDFEEVIMSNRLSYLQLVIKETLRLHPPVPLLLPRECRKTCQVMGYEIPEKARVMVNVWAIGRDPKYWEESEAFKPERYEKTPREFNGTDFEFLPFGAGRRICPGVQFGLVLVELALANLLYYFDWEYLAGKGGEELDMSEKFGVAVGRKFPLHLRAIQRFALPKF